MGAIVPFDFEGAEVRVLDQNGEPWFVAADVCKALNLTNPSVAVRALDEDEKAKFNLGIGSDATLISESGVFALILRCRDATTPGTVPHRVRRWVTGEVLPAIRKTGSYGAPDPMVALNDPSTMRGLLLSYSEKVLALEAKNAELAVKGDALDRIATAEGSLCITDAAKTLQVQPRALFSFLRAHRWIYSRQGSDEIAYQDKLASGLLEHKTTTVHRSDGSEKVRTQVRVTPKGLTRLAKEFQSVVSVA